MANLPTPNAPTGHAGRSASRAVHRVNEMTTRPYIAVGVAIGVAAAWVVIVASGFDEGIQFAFGSVCGGVTVTMMFVLQHTQRRAQSALQLKLDEVVRAIPQADNHLIGFEASSDDELLDREKSHLADHVTIRKDDGDPDKLC